MATATELLRAAEHIKGMADADRKCTTDVTRTGRAMMLLGAVVVMCEEAARLQAHEEPHARARRHHQRRAGHVQRVCRCILVGRDREASAPRSWPDGWPPFAVLRRAHRLLNVTPTPSTRWLENNGHKHDLDRARSIRADWDEALAAEVYGELPPEEVAR